MSTGQPLQVECTMCTYTTTALEGMPRYARHGFEQFPGGEARSQEGRLNPRRNGCTLDGPSHGG